MSIIKRSPRNNYTAIRNAVAQDERLSWEASGLLLHLLSLPPEWIVRTSDLQKRRGGAAGRDKIRRMVNELIEAGYIKAEQPRNPDGTVGPVEYIVDQYMD